VFPTLVNFGPFPFALRRESVDLDTFNRSDSSFVVRKIMWRPLVVAKDASGDHAITVLAMYLVDFEFHALSMVEHQANCGVCWFG